MVLLNARQYDQERRAIKARPWKWIPTLFSAHHRLGLVYEQQGKYDQAIEQFKQVTTLSPGKPLGLAALAHAYALAGKQAEAEKGSGGVTGIIPQAFRFGRFNRTDIYCLR